MKTQNFHPFRYLIFFQILLSFTIIKLQAQDQVLTGNAVSALKEFGFSVDVNGNYLVVGDPNPESNAQNFYNQGKAYVYKYDQGTHLWTWMQTLVVPEKQGLYPQPDSYTSAGPRGFGYSVAIDGDFIAVAAPYYMFCSICNPTYYVNPMVFIFKRVNDTWVAKQALIETRTPLTNSYFGFGLDMCGANLIIGDPRNASTTGYALIYERTGDTYSLTSTIDRPFGNSYSVATNFGNSVAIGTNVAVVSEYLDNTGNYKGYAYVYKKVNGTWQYSNSFLNNSQYGNSYFGSDMAITSDDSRLIIGASNTTIGSTIKGEAYVYKLNNSGNYEILKTLRPKDDADQLSGIGFGTSVSIENKTCIVGAPLEQSGRGAGYYFAVEEGGDLIQYEDKKILPTGMPEKFKYGYATAISNGLAVVSGKSDASISNNRGQVYIYPLVPKIPSIFNASKETYSDKINLTWSPATTESNSTFKTTDFVLAIDNIANTVAPNGNNYTHDNLKPGEIHHYFLKAKNAFGESDYLNAAGRAAAIGKINGKVTAGNSSTGVPGVAICTYTRNASVHLNGTSTDCLRCPALTSFQPSEYTIDFWVKTNDKTKSTVFSFGLPCLYNPSNLIFNNTLIDFKTGMNVSDGIWHHIAITQSGNDIKFYKDGLLANSLNIANNLLATDTLCFGKDLLDLRRTILQTGYLNGNIDEIRVWNSSLDANKILSIYGRTPETTETGLTNWWRLDDGLYGNPRRSYDNTKGGNELLLMGNASWVTDTTQVAPIKQISYTNSSGNYSLSRLDFGNSWEFKVAPLVTEGRNIVPLLQKVTLLHSDDIGNTDYIANNVDFKDNSVTTVSGKVTYFGTNCPVVNAEISVAGQPLTVKTDAEGNYVVGGIPYGEQTVIVSFHNHVFSPAKQVIQVNGQITGVNFTDLQTSKLSGIVAGGSCKISIGEAKLNIVSISGGGSCFDTTINTVNGKYNLQLPAFEDVQIFLTDLSSPDGDLILQGLKGYIPLIKNISLATGDTIADFIYHSEPKFEITGLPQTNQCGKLVLNQGETFPVTISVIETYGNTQCPADEGTIEIVDNISDVDSVAKYSIDSTGTITYLVKVGEPNIIGGFTHPYEKKFEILASTPAGSKNSTTWAIVTGSHPRTKTFTTVSPEIPLVILRDPPGDGSYSFLEKSTSTCINTSLSVEQAIDVSRKLDLKVGTSFETGLGFSTSTEIYAAVNSSFTVSKKNLTQTSSEYCIETASNFQTSGNDNATGADGDVYIGAAFNIIYALTDVLSVDENCDVQLSQSIMYGNEGLQTQYAYTEEHIKNQVIPDLKHLAEIEPDAYKKQRYTDQISVWNQTLELNKKLKASALSNSDFPNNLTFSNNVPLQFSTTTTSTQKESISFNLYLDAEVAIEAGLDIAGSGFTIGVGVKASMNMGKSIDVSAVKSNKVGFYLYDDDLGDAFTIDVKRDPVYATPVFDLVAGTSRCPVEPGTNAREGVRLTIDKNLQSDINPQQVATFKLTLANTAESGGASRYELAAVSTSNPDGAVMLVNGTSIKDLDAFYIEPGQSVDATLTVARGPLAFDYENLQISLRSLCDGSIEDVTSFSVRYTNPCSGVTMFRPFNGWLLNKASNDSLRFILKDYNASQLTAMNIQYSPAGKNQWKDAFIVPASLLSSPEAILYWNIANSNIADGNYDIRARVTCNSGVTYSALASGLIDRSSPAVFGTPEPADGLYQKQDEISVNFTEDLDASRTTLKDISLINQRTAEKIPFEFQIKDSKILIQPSVSQSEIEDQPLQVTVSKAYDKQGNAITGPVSWNFVASLNAVNWNKLKTETSAVQYGPKTRCTARLINTGSIAVNYSISELPAWISVSETTGTLPAQDDELITFVVDSTLTPGIYTDTIVATTQLGNRKLIIEANVSCAAPTWNVDGSTFSKQMTLVAGVYAQGLSVTGINDLLSVWSGPELRGVAKMQYIVPQEEYIAYLVIYGNDGPNDSLTFKLWDASACSLVDIGNKIAFKADSAMGTGKAPDSLFVSASGIQELTINKGWNWVSFRVNPGDKSIQSVLKSLKPQQNLIIVGQDAFSYYQPGFGWVGTLDTLSHGKLYKIKTELDNPQKIYVSGNEVVGTNQKINLTKGWNWIGNYKTSEIPVDSVLKGYAANEGDVIKSRDALSNYHSQMWQGTLSKLQPGAGYMMYVNASDTLKYNTKRVTSNQNSINSFKYELTMDITGILQINGALVSGNSYAIGAYQGNELRGYAKPKFCMNKWMYFLTVFSDNAGESFTFKATKLNTYDTIPLAGSVTFSSLVGTPDNPYVFSDGTVLQNIKAPEDPANYVSPVLASGFELNQNYPNPFYDYTTIKFEIPSQCKVKLVITDLMGKTYKVVEDNYEPGSHEIGFNRGNIPGGLYIYELFVKPVNSPKWIEMNRKMLVE